MGRPKALDRKKQLLEEILEHLRHKTLASVTFRTLADALGVSSYVLVYQFGNREALLGDIVREVDYRILNLGLPQDLEFDFAGFEELVMLSTRHLEDDKTRHLLRLQIEAATMDIVSSKPTHAMGRYMDMWAVFAEEYLEGLGYPKDFAHSMADSLVNQICGIRFRYALTGDTEASDAAVKTALAGFKEILLLNLEKCGLTQEEMLSKKVSAVPQAQAAAVENRPNPAR